MARTQVQRYLWVSCKLLLCLLQEITRSSPWCLYHPHFLFLHDPQPWVQTWNTKLLHPNVWTLELWGLPFPSLVPCFCSWIRVHLWQIQVWTWFGQTQNCCQSEKQTMRSGELWLQDWSTDLRKTTKSLHPWGSQDHSDLYRSGMEEQPGLLPLLAVWPNCGIWYKALSERHDRELTAPCGWAPKENVPANQPSL